MSKGVVVREPFHASVWQPHFGHVETAGSAFKQHPEEEWPKVLLGVPAPGQWNPVLRVMVRRHHCGDGSTGEAPTQCLDCWAAQAETTAPVPAGAGERGPGGPNRVKWPRPQATSHDRAPLERGAIQGRSNPRGVRQIRWPGRLRKSRGGWRGVRRIRRPSSREGKEGRVRDRMIRMRSSHLLSRTRGCINQGSKSPNHVSAHNRQRRASQPEQPTSQRCCHRTDGSRRSGQAVRPGRSFQSQQRKAHSDPK